MRNTLTDNGFYHYDTCNCGGVKTQKFKHTTLALEVHIKPNKREFVLFQYDKKVRFGMEGELTDALQQYA